MLQNLCTHTLSWMCIVVLSNLHMYVICTSNRKISHPTDVWPYRMKCAFAKCINEFHDKWYSTNISIRIETFKSLLVFSKLFWWIKETKQYKWHLLVILKIYWTEVELVKAWWNLVLFFALLHIHRETHKEVQRKKMKSFFRKSRNHLKFIYFVRCKLPDFCDFSHFYRFRHFCVDEFLSLSLTIFSTTLFFIVIEFGNRFSLGYHFKRKFIFEFSQNIV